MKKTVLCVLLIGLLLSEAFLCSAFLPMSWQLAIQRVLPQGGDHSRMTHPDLEREIDHALQQHPGLRIALYAVLVLLLSGNSLLLILVWRRCELRFASLRSGHSYSEIDRCVGVQTSLFWT